jgi:hypothetical protein
MMIVGSVISVNTRPPTSGADEYRQTQQSEHDRRHRRQIVDIDFDQVGPFVAGSEFLQVNRGRDPDGEGQHQRYQQGIERTHQRAAYSGELGFARIPGVQQHPVEPLFHGVRRFQPIQPGQLPVVEAALRFRQLAVDMTFVIGVHVAARVEPYALRGAQPLGTCPEFIRQPVFRAAADQSIEFAPFPPLLNFGKHGLQRLAYRAHVIRRTELVLVIEIRYCQSLRIESDIQLDVGFLESRQAVAEYRQQQENEKRDRARDGEDAVKTETPLRSVALLQASFNPFRHSRPCIYIAIHTALCTCAPHAVRLRSESE